MLEVVTIATPGLGDRSYLVHDGDVALVVDPQRDIDRVLAAADAAGVGITHVAETHLHNDYVTGGLELSRVLGARYLLAAADRVFFERTPVADGDEFEVGALRVHVLSTPGHTPHHVAYLVDGAGQPGALLTGGCLLYGTVGRTDLSGPELTEELTRAQYRSARRLADDHPDEVAVWPTHGFGSFCSSARSSGLASSSMGQERRTNIALTLENEDAFVTRLLGGLTAHPTYYAHMGPINQAGPPSVDLLPPRVLDAGELHAHLEAGGWVVDLGPRRAYARGHLRGAVSVELGDPFATYLGWVLPWGAPLTLVGDTAAQVAEAQRALFRIGIDHLDTAAGPREELAAGRPLASYPVSDFKGLHGARQAGRSLVVLDVRRDDERAQGALEDSVHVPLHELPGRMSELPPGELWVHCASGFRASIAASLIDRAGRRVVLVDDEWTGAAQAGLHTRSGRAAPFLPSNS